MQRVHRPAGYTVETPEADKAVKRFREHDERRLYAHYGLHDDEQKMIDLATEAAVELEELFAQDAEAETG